MDLRPVVRFLAERFPRLAPWAIRLRSGLHIATGNPIQTLAGIDAVLLWLVVGWPFRWVGSAFVVICVVAEMAHRLGLRHGLWLSAWREAWRFRRRWPADWAGIAAKTTRVQAEVGTSKEPIASAVLRPVADHPKMSWWPRIEWPVVSWWVGPPPGRSLTALDELTTILAANISRADDRPRRLRAGERLPRPTHRLFRRRPRPALIPHLGRLAARRRRTTRATTTSGPPSGTRRPTATVATAPADRRGGRTMTSRLLARLGGLISQPQGRPRGWTSVDGSTAATW